MVGAKNFKFDKRWLSKPNFEEVVHAGWATERQGVDPLVGERIINCRQSISRWRKRDQVSTTEGIAELEARLEEAQSSDITSLENITAIQEQLCIALKEEEIYWHHKSRVTWHQEGDQNISFFTKQRRTRNKIIGILKEDGEWTEKKQEVEQTATQYLPECLPPRQSQTLRRL